MMLMMFAAAMIATGPSVPEDIVIARADWGAMPALETVRMSLPTSRMVGRVQEIFRARECVMDGQRPDRFNLDVNYAVRIAPTGDVTEIMVEDIGCRAIEDLVGVIAANIVRAGYVRTAAPGEPTRYASRVNFNLS